MAITCPICGFSNSKDYNYVREIEELEFHLTPKTYNLIKKVGKLVSNNIPTENTMKKYWMFLKRIENAKKQAIIKGLNAFYSRGLYLEGKGFDYLATMINNANKNSKRRLEIERKLVGITPPVKEVF